jgi:N-acetylneuraminate synthase
MNINGQEIRNFTEPYIIAELGANHNGDMEIARNLIVRAKEAGCHCVKFQSWTKDTIFARKVYEENYFLSDDYRNRTDFTLEEIVEKFSVSEEQLREIHEFCRQLGIGFACTPFSKTEADFLVDGLDVAFIKVASMDLNNYAFLSYLAGRQKPVMLSTGLSSLSEIDRAVETIEAAGNRQIILMHCVSVYPPQDECVHLNNLDMLRSNYPDYPVGYSDHTIGTAMPLAAIAKGAAVLEKHFTLDKEMFGWDHKVSANFEEMREIVANAGRVVKALGSYRRIVSDAEKRQIPAYRRSIVAARLIPKGKTIVREDLDVKRPGTGIEPQYLEMVLGRVAKRDIAYDTVLCGEDF